MTAGRYDQKRRKLIADGAWLYRTPAAEVAAHVDRLRAAGMSGNRIAAAAGVAERTIRNLHSRRHVQGSTAAAILAVEPRRRPVRAGLIPGGVGVARRIQGLAAIGWPLLTQARRLGVSVQWVWDLAQEKSPHVKAGTFERVSDLFEELSATPGPSRRARNMAVRNGWMPPLAWNDIDDPGEVPDLGGRADDVPDPMVVERALGGERLPLTCAEKQAALAEGIARGMSLSRTAVTLGINYRSARQIVGREEQLAS